MPVVDLSCGCRHYSGPERLDYKQDRLCRYHEGHEDGRAEERAAIVAWLRDPHVALAMSRQPMVLADAIERGEHMKGGT